MRLNIIDRYFLWIISALTVAVALLMMLLIIAADHEPQIITKTIKVPVEKIVYKKVILSKSFVNITKEDLMQDLISHYKNVSLRQKKIIIDTILEESKKANINPLIIYSLVYAESSFTPETLHKRRLINVFKKDSKGKPTKKLIKQYIQAIGLGGIVWELWGYQLRQAGILETKSDLFDPAINIKATIFVYNQAFNKKVLKGVTYRDHSAMLRYFGGNHPSYITRIEIKIMDLISPKLYRK